MLRAISRNLPPLASQLTMGSGGVPAIVNPQSGSALSFKISENRSQSVTVSLYVQGTCDGQGNNCKTAVTEAATASLAAGDSGTGSAQSANISGPVNWNAKSVALFNTNDSDASLLPREANFQTNWKGVVAGGDGAALADGNYTLCLKVSDGDGNISDCDTSVRFLLPVRFRASFHHRLLFARETVPAGERLFIIYRAQGRGLTR